MEKEYISKEYLLKELKELNIVSFYELNEHSKEAYEDFKGLIEWAPTEKIKEGVWVPGREIGKSFIGDLCIDIQYEDWSCSICNESIRETFRPRYKYCPHCGAKMRGYRGEFE